ncbi:hypothetical protein Z043_108740 [Scleropages formosus]|uniref:Uncharacterized protein n=1 Tax=Scleropages formosus TaxID=113540 RepID=A0A0P7YW05_SCLFO|nr:hypothetical protein Z043_108740 [Scleropages formosus]
MVQKYQSPVRVYKHPFEMVMARCVSLPPPTPHRHETVEGLVRSQEQLLSTHSQHMSTTHFGSFAFSERICLPTSGTKNGHFYGNSSRLTLE